jgi:hypothetical protein
MAVTDEQRTFDAVRSAVQCKVFNLFSCFSEILDTAYDGADSISCLPTMGQLADFSEVIGRRDGLRSRFCGLTQPRVLSDGSCSLVHTREGYRKDGSLADSACDAYLPTEHFGESFHNMQS